MANQIVVTQNGNVQVSIEPTPNVQVQISRAAITTLTDVPTANFANFAGNVTGANQPNITNIGTLANLTVSNSATIGNLTVTGNLAIGNLVANTANYANFAGEAFNVSGSNVTGTVANATYADNAGNATIANSANSVAGANVSGEVAFAAVANSVAGANVFGTVANATYAINAGHANTANTVTDNAQPNITSVGTLTGLDVNGNITANVITANTFVGNIALTQVDYIDFDTANGAPSFQTGRVYWDNTKDTLAIDMNAGGNITQQVGEDQYIYIKANATISAGQVVMFNGVQGDTILGAPANTASAGFIPRYVMGVAPANIASGSNGYVQTVGEIYDLQTNAFPAGSILYLQANSNGAMTVTEPTAPDPKIILAACLTQSSTPSATNGRIQVRPEAGYYMNQLHNVSNVTATTGDVLVYNSSNVYTPSNTVPVANLATYATTANSVAGANVSGEVAYAAVANSVAGANVSGDVSGANHANIADVANSVAGANVSGEVAYAAVANSVAVANVSGIGNIATINLDGSSSNVLYGNGAWATISIPPGDQISNGTSNVSIPVANGAVAVSVNNVANLVMIENGGAVNAFPTTSAINMLRINTFNNPLSDAHRVAWARARGTNASPTSVQANDNLGVLSFFGHNGTSYQTSSVGFVRARVDASYTANGANIPIGMQVLVNDTNGGINNQTKTHNFYSNGNVTFAQYVNATGFIGDGGNLSNIQVGNVTGLGNIATINLDGNSSNALLGDGSFGPVEVQSTSIANGTSNVSIPTSNGNINFSTNNNANVVVIDTTSAINAYPLSTAINALRINTIGNPLGDAHRVAWARSRGTIASPTSVQANDSIGSLSMFAHNGTSYVTSLPVLIRGIVDSTYTTNTANIPLGLRFTVAQTTESGASNTAISHNFYSNGNVTFSGYVNATGFAGDGGNLTNLPGANITGEVANANYASYANIANVANSVAVANVVGIGNIATINLDGNVSNALLGDGSFGPVEVQSTSIANGTSNINIPVANGTIAFSSNNVANVLTLENGGLVNAFPTSSTVNMLRINTYGNPLGDAHRLTWIRYRGSNASPTSVQANDNLGVIAFLGHNGSNVPTGSVGFIRARVDASYTANTGNIPIGMQVIVNDTNGGINNQSKTHNFYSNGYTTLAGGLTSDSLNTGDIFSGNINAFGSGISAGNTINLAIDNNTTQAILQSTYNNANIQTGTWTSWRHRGTSASPLPVLAGDEISKFQSVVRADSGNTYYPTVDQAAVVISNDGVGNVATEYRVRVYNSGSKFSVMAPKLTIADSNDFGANATIYANGYIDTVSTVNAANVSITSGGFMKMPTYTISALTAITGSAGWTASVTDSTPGGMLAYWDTTNSRWSYVHDNSAV